METFPPNCKPNHLFENFVNWSHVNLRGPPKATPNNPLIMPYYGLISWGVWHWGGPLRFPWWRSHPGKGSLEVKGIGSSDSIDIPSKCHSIWNGSSFHPPPPPKKKNLAPKIRLISLPNKHPNNLNNCVHVPSKHHAFLFFRFPATGRWVFTSFQAKSHFPFWELGHLAYLFQKHTYPPWN